MGGNRSEQNEPSFVIKLSHSPQGERGNCHQIVTIRKHRDVLI
jgi:hypothetical protein